MLKRDRVVDPAFGIALIIFVTLALWAVASVAYLHGAHREAEYYRAQDEKKYTQEGVQDVCGGSASPRFVECVMREARAHAKQGNEYKDLQAQEKMALWARWMFVASALAAIGAVGALFWLRLTWGETRRAADIAQNAFLMAERPHVFVGDLEAVTPLFSDYLEGVREPSLDFFEVVFDVQNHGKTPAIIKSLQSSVRMLPDLVGEPEFFGGETSNFEIIIPAERAKSAAQFMRRKINDEELQTVRMSREVFTKNAQVLHIYFYVKIIYTSVAGSVDEVMAAFRYDPRVNDFLPADSPTFNYRRLGKATDQD